MAPNTPETDHGVEETSQPTQVIVQKGGKSLEKVQWLNRQARAKLNGGLDEDKDVFGEDDIEVDGNILGEAAELEGSEIMLNDWDGMEKEVAGKKMKTKLSSKGPVTPTPAPMGKMPPSYACERCKRRDETCYVSSGRSQRCKSCSDSKQSCSFVKKDTSPAKTPKTTFRPRSKATPPSSPQRDANTIVVNSALIPTPRKISAPSTTPSRSRLTAEVVLRTPSRNRKTEGAESDRTLAPTPTPVTSMKTTAKTAAQPASTTSGSTAHTNSSATVAVDSSGDVEMQTPNSLTSASPSFSTSLLSPSPTVTGTKRLFPFGQQVDPTTATTSKKQYHAQRATYYEKMVERHWRLYDMENE